MSLIARCILLLQERNQKRCLRSSLFYSKQAVKSHHCGITPRMSCPRQNDYDLADASQVVSGVHAMCIENLMELEMVDKMLSKAKENVRDNIAY